MKGIIGMFLIIGMSGVAHAQSSTTNGNIEGTSVAPLAEIKPEVLTKRMGVRLGVTTQSNLNRFDDQGNTLENDYLVAPSFKITDKITATLTAIYIQDLKQEANSDFDNTTLSISHKPIDIVPDYLNMAPAITGLAPTNQDARTKTSLQGAVGASTTWTLDFKKMGAPATLSYIAAATRNIHEFSRKNTGTSNIEYSFTNGLAAGYEVINNLTLSAAGKLVSGYTYTESWRSKFEITESIGYKVAENIDVSVGHTNNGNTLKSDMQTSNVELFNENTSSIFAGLEVVY
jgi:hypothetical protein